MKSNRTTRRPWGPAAWVAAACLALACAIPAVALADGSLFGSLMGKASSQAQGEEVKFDLNKSKFSIEDGEVRSLIVSLDPETLERGPVVWESSDPAVVSVDAEGHIEALSKGTATITASLVYDEDTTLTDSCEVTVVNNKELTAQEVLFESEHDYANGCDDEWTYSNPYVTSVYFTFDERTAVEDGFDFIEILDVNGVPISRYTGTELAGERVWVDGSDFTIRLVSDEENVAWGFALTEIDPQYQEGWVDDGVNVYYIVNGEKATGLWQIDGEWHWFDEKTGAWGPVPSDVEVPKDPIGVEDPEEGEGPRDPIGVETPDEELTFFMPNLVGMSLWDARDLCNVLVYGCDDQWAYSDTVPWGIVMAQDVPADTIVEQGGGVLVTVSAGPEYNPAPNMYGFMLEEAQAALYDIACSAWEVWVYDPVAPYGMVMSQDVVPDTPLRQGSVVTLTVSAGPEPGGIAVPEVCGMWYEDAYWDILNSGLSCQLNFVRSDLASAGTVIDQSPWPDKVLQQWETVTITVSLGMDYDFMPDYYGYHYRDPLDSLRSWGFSVVVDDSAVPMDDSMAGIIYSTYPYPEKLVPLGGTVTLYIYRHADGTPIIMG